MEMYGSGVKIGMMKKKKEKFFLVVLGSIILAIHVVLFGSIGILLFVSIVVVFAFSELSLRFCSFLPLGFLLFDF